MFSANLNIFLLHFGEIHANEWMRHNWYVMLLLNLYIAEHTPIGEPLALSSNQTEDSRVYWYTGHCTNSCILNHPRTDISTSLQWQDWRQSNCCFYGQTAFRLVLFQQWNGKPKSFNLSKSPTARHKCINVLGELFWKITLYWHKQAIFNAVMTCYLSLTYWTSFNAALIHQRQGVNTKTENIQSRCMPRITRPWTLEPSVVHVNKIWSFSELAFPVTKTCTLQVSTPFRLMHYCRQGRTQLMTYYIVTGLAIRGSRPRFLYSPPRRRRGPQKSCAPQTLSV